MPRRRNRKLKKGAKPREPSQRSGRQQTLRHAFGVLGAGFAFLVLLSLASVSRAGGNLAGPIGAHLARGLLERAGLLSFLVPLTTGALSTRLLTGIAWPRPLLLRVLSGTLAAACGLALVALVAPGALALGAPVGGDLLEALVRPLEAALSTVGGALIVAALGWIALSHATAHQTSRAAGIAFSWLSGLVALTFGWFAETLRTAWRNLREDEEASPGDGALDAESLDDAVAFEAARRSDVLARRRASRGDEPAWVDEPAVTAPALVESEPEILTIGEDGRVRGKVQAELAQAIELPTETLAEPSAEPLRASPPPPPPEVALELSSTPPAIVDAPELPKRRAKKEKGAFQLVRTGAGFTLPSIDLLETPPDIHAEIDRDALTETAMRLTAKLSDFGIKGRVETIRPGPVITMYEFVPAPGIRVSKIASLADDLAMAMEALQVRIVAPIPGKNVVGIEVPNRQRQKVFLKEILEEDAFQKMTSPLTLAFGKDTEGAPYVGDLSRMPHLLVAGTTGSGKSVSMNSMIMSLLFKASPEDVRLIMIDPKMVELSMYEGIPHLLLPVVQDAQKAPLALRWAVEEMERRYQLIGKLKVKDLKTYNEKVARMKRGELAPEAAPEAPKKVVVVDVAQGETEEEALARLESQMAAPKGAAAASGPSPDELEKLPYIVIIIDELADLMMVASRDVELCIARIAAKARAAGIHLVIATQRPSTDVISGVIKSNLPVRIAFRLASRHDSATIINGPGAERLLGEGDMLHIPPGASDALRLHGALVRESEIERVVDFWKSQGKPVYDEEILKPRGEEREGGGADDVPDEIYDQAIHVVSQLERVSISLLQRKMGVGYNRAADLIERLEREGVIGPPNGVKPREVLIKAVGEMQL
ncbi:MAG: FtsK/SpoIIIE family DNA translocase [Deltaproteobacteria bacterium]